MFTVTPADKLVLSSLKQAEDGDGVLMRLWNNSDEDVGAMIACAMPLGSCQRVRLDETHPEEVEVDGNAVACVVGPHKILTLRVRGKQRARMVTGSATPSPGFAPTPRSGAGLSAAAMTRATSLQQTH